jgi:hypothetical protein
VEVRSTYRGSWSSKSLVAIMVVGATIGLGVTAGVVAKNLSAPAAPQTHRIVQGLGGAAQENPARRGGLQIVGGNGATTSAVGPDERPTTTKLTPAYQQFDTRGVKPAAINNLQVDTRGIIPAEAFGVAQKAPNSFLGPDALDRNAMLVAGSAPNSFLGPDAQERNAALAAPSARPVVANARGHRWI